MEFHGVEKQMHYLKIFREWECSLSLEGTLEGMYLISEAINRRVKSRASTLQRSCFIYQQLKSFKEKQGK